MRMSPVRFSVLLLGLSMLDGPWRAAAQSPDGGASPRGPADRMPSSKGREQGSTTWPWRATTASTRTISWKAAFPTSRGERLASVNSRGTSFTLRQPFSTWTRLSR